MGKIIRRSELRGLIGDLRRQGNTIVTMNGSFDLLHAGHVRCLQEAREQGDVLIVPLNSDRSVGSYKGTGRPIVPEGERAEMLAALCSVDYVVLFDETNCKAVISEISPDVHCNGADWGPGCIEREVVEKAGGRLHILKWSPGKSTSDLLRRIRSGGDSPAAVFLPATIPGRHEGEAAALKTLMEMGLRLILFLPHDAAQDAALRALESSGVIFDGTYALSARTAMEHARDGLGLALGSSWLISGEMSHIVMAREVNAKTILIGAAPQDYVMPHYEAENLSCAVSIIQDASQQD